MSYLLQTEENKKAGKHFSADGDIVVSDDFRAVYRIAPDGSRRRLREPENIARFVKMAKDYLEEQELQKVRDAEARANAAALGTELKARTNPRLNAETLALLLAGGGLMGNASLLSGLSPHRLARIGK